MARRSSIFALGLLLAASVGAQEPVSASAERPGASTPAPTDGGSLAWRLFWNDDEFLLLERFGRTQHGVRVGSPLGERSIPLERFRLIESTRPGRTIVERPGALSNGDIALPKSRIAPTAGVIRLRFTPPGSEVGADPGKAGKAGKVEEGRAASPMGLARLALNAGRSTLLTIVIDPRTGLARLESGTMVVFSLPRRIPDGPAPLEIRYQTGRADVYLADGLIGGWRRAAPPPDGLTVTNPTGPADGKEPAPAGFHWGDLIWTSIARDESPRFDHPADWRVTEFDGSVWLGHWPESNVSATLPGAPLGGEFRLIGPSETALRIPESAVRSLRGPVQRPRRIDGDPAPARAQEPAIDLAEARGPRLRVDLGAIGLLEAPGERTQDGGCRLRHPVLGSLIVPAPLVRQVATGADSVITELESATVHLGVTPVESFHSMEPIGTRWSSLIAKGNAGRLICSMRVAESATSTDAIPVSPSHPPIVVTLDGKPLGLPAALPTLDERLPDPSDRFRRLRFAWPIPARTNAATLVVRVTQREGRPPACSVELTRILVEAAP
jgi:hypothetical protein